MPLGYTMETMEGVNEEVAKLYTESEGKFILTGVEGVSPKSKVDEFRNTNIELKNQLKTFEGIDPVATKAMKTEIDELKIRLEKTDLDEEQIEKIVSSRVEAMKTEYETTTTTLSTENQALKEKVNVLVLDGQSDSASLEHGIADSALGDVKNRVRSVFSIGDDGKLVGKDAEGNVLYGADGTKELSISEYVKSLTKTAPHLFKESVKSTIPTRIGFKGDASKLSPLQKISGGLN